MPRRCYSRAPIDGETVSLEGAEAHHLLHVLRASPGDRFIVFDGSGAEFDAEVAACRRTTVELTIESVRQVDRELPFELTLGCPLPKGDRSRWIVEKAVELGAARIVPLVTEFSERAAHEFKSMEKLRRYVIEASKQCGRNRLLALGAPLSWAEWLALPSDAAPQPASKPATRWIAHPGGLALEQVRRAQVDGPTFMAVGPEGGLAEREIDQAHIAGWEIVSLGPRILRIETAAVALMVAAALEPIA